MALAHRLGHLKGPAGAVPGGKDPGEVGGHAPVHLDGPVLGGQTGQKVGGCHRPAEDEHPGAGEKGSVGLQSGDRLLPLDGQPPCLT